MGRRVSSFINGAHFLHGVVNLHARVFGSGIVEHDVTTRACEDEDAPIDEFLFVGSTLRHSAQGASKPTLCDTL